MVMKRGSSVECSGSGIVPASGSPKTAAASSKETPCFLRLSAAFCGSHSNFTHRAYSQLGSARDLSGRPNTLVSQNWPINYPGETRSLEVAEPSAGCPLTNADSLYLKGLLRSRRTMRTGWARAAAQLDLLAKGRGLGAERSQLIVQGVLTSSVPEARHAGVDHRGAATPMTAYADGA